MHTVQDLSAPSHEWSYMYKKFQVWSNLQFRDIRPLVRIETFQGDYAILCTCSLLQQYCHLKLYTYRLAEELKLYQVQGDDKSSVHSAGHSAMGYLKHITLTPKG